MLGMSPRQSGIRVGILESTSFMHLSSLSTFTSLLTLPLSAPNTENSFSVFSSPNVLNPTGQPYGPIPTLYIQSRPFCFTTLVDREFLWEFLATQLFSTTSMCV
ncbi:hypothetical protein E2C01_068312 [Portunus trituberculatus]|uniref:Uncharacterized protein n=1 Tax=Portunus trituberculatus TaxID=210409 RepID=A0A5B7HW54_PORTR|nr:hypothetical protein [Portunus trituberculatus]